MSDSLAHRLKSGISSEKIFEFLWQTWLHPRHIIYEYQKQALKEARLYAKGRLLDIGCGLRPYESLFKKYIDEYVGIDWPMGPDRAYMDVVGDALLLPFCDGSFDTLLITEVLEHLPSPDRLLQEAARLLKKDGILILTIPFMEPLHAEPRDYYRFTPYSLQMLLEQYGFHMAQIWRRGGWWSVMLSFLGRSLFSLANPLDEEGRRHYNLVGTAFVLPWCALAQWAGYTLDHMFNQIETSKFTLGFVVVGTRQGSF